MKTGFKTTVLLTAALVLAACGGGGGAAAPSTPAPLTGPLLRLVNAGIDAPAVTVTANGSLADVGLAYAAATALQHQPAASYEIKFNAILPDNSTQTVVDQSGITLTADNETTVYLVGSLKAGSAQALTVNRPLVDVPSGKVELQAVHAAANAPAVSVYVTNPGDSLANAQPIANLSFPAAGAPVDLPAGDYRVRVTKQGDPTTVYFDTGASTGVTLAAGRSLQLALIDNTGPGSAPVRVLLLDGRNTSQPYQLLLDAATPARLRAVNASPDAGPIDVYATATGTAYGTTPLFANLAYASSQTACSQAAATDDLEATAAGQGPANPLPGLSLSDQVLAAGQPYALFALGRVKSSPSAQLALAAIDERGIATEADLRFVHGAPALGAVNVYVNPASQYSDTQIQSGAVTPTVQNLQPGQIGAELRFAPASASSSGGTTTGGYDIRVTDAASNSIDVEQKNVSLNAGLRETLVLLGADESGSGGPSQPSLLALANGECP